MKCPKCNHNQLRGQEGLKCKKCKYRFIFDPKSHYCGTKRMTDGYFVSCIDKVSRNNTYFFTEDELYCFMAQRTKSSLAGCMIGSIFLAFILCIVGAGLFEVWYLGLLILPFLIFYSIRRSRRALSRKHWGKLLKRWQKKSQKDPEMSQILSGLLVSPQLIQEPSAVAELDIYDYGAAKLLICQHDIQVDWLVMNEFHTQQGIVIVSETGYPSYVSERVSQLLETNSELEIYTLHNAGVAGEGMRARLQRGHSPWDFSRHETEDLGLTEEHLRQTKIKPNVIEEYKGDFPLHGLNYHQFLLLMNHALLNNLTLGSAAAALAVSSDASFSSGGGDFG